MKLAISGKGGVGKSTLAGALALLLAGRGNQVLALDADPDANLASALGFPAELQEQIVPLSRQINLIEERTGAKVNTYGQMFKLNPDVSDIADSYATYYRGIALLVLGAIEQGGSGCACPESVLIRALVTDLVLYKDDILIMDMEAGIEHLGRATARGVDTMLVVVEPGRRSVDSARRIIHMSEQIGITRIQLVGNKVNEIEDEQFLRESFPEHDLLDIIPYSEDIRLADRNGIPITDCLSPELTQKFETILNRVIMSTTVY